MMNSNGIYPNYDNYNGTYPINLIGKGRVLAFAY